MAILYYIHDPMCSWCYAFKPVYQKLLNSLPESISTINLLGGLAADTDQPMPVEMQQQLKATWQGIEQKVPGTVFNYDFWDKAEQTHPRRSTYPACRAVISARCLQSNSESAMIEGIQQAYYQQALNPSDDQVLVKVAKSIGLHQKAFKTQLNAVQTQQILDHEISHSRQLNVSSYPSLILQTGTSAWPVTIDYNNYQNILNTIDLIMDFQ